MAGKICGYQWKSPKVGRGTRKGTIQGHACTERKKEDGSPHDGPHICGGCGARK